MPQPIPLHFLSRQLNRPSFDHHLRQHAAQSGVKFLVGKARSVEIGRGSARHHLSVKTPDGTLAHLSSRWIVDATGQNRFIGKKVTAYTRPHIGQRSAFWFRLANFEPFLPQVKLSMRRPLEYDVWHSTHHFMGRGNWIWCIPLKTTQHSRLISVGISYRPDVYSRPMRDIQDFLTAVDTEHPALSEMVRSGDVLDGHAYHNYLYSADEIYSPDSWFLVGNAARTVDPLYSTGLAMVAIQIQQVTTLIKAELADQIIPEDRAVLSSLWRRINAIRQVDITDQYVTMHDPFSAHLRRYWNLNGWWNALLPLWWHGFLTEPQGARLLSRLLKDHDPANVAAWSLFRAVSSQLSEVSQADFDRTLDFDQIINRRFDQSIASVPQQLSRHFQWRLRIRLRLLQIGGWQQLPSQLRSIIQDVIRMLLVKYGFSLVGRHTFQTLKSPLEFDHAGAAQHDHSCNLTGSFTYPTQG